nr:hypothetical protein [Micrococcus luteus]
MKHALKHCLPVSAKVIHDTNALGKACEIPPELRPHLQALNTFSCSEAAFDFIDTARTTNAARAAVSIWVVCLRQKTTTWDQAKDLF